MPIKACVFDAYGTLFDVGAAARVASEEPGRDGLADRLSAVSGTWRRKQLEYSWHRAITGQYVPFWEVTKNALDYALEEQGIEDDDLRERLLALYWELEAYEEVPRVLSALNEQGRTTAILSNGSPDMLHAAVESAGIGGSLDAVLSVDEVKTFKPRDAVYEIVGDRLGVAPDEVLFVSSNCWDVIGATLFGFETAWVNRKGEPLDRLGVAPAHRLDDLTGIPEIAGRS